MNINLPYANQQQQQQKQSSGNNNNKSLFSDRVLHSK